MLPFLTCPPASIRCNFDTRRGFPQSGTGTQHTAENYLASHWELLYGGAGTSAFEKFGCHSDIYERYRQRSFRNFSLISSFESGPAMIKQIKIENNKSIPSLELELGRVNVLIGENGRGKLKRILPVS